MMKPPPPKVKESLRALFGKKYKTLPNELEGKIVEYVTPFKKDHLKKITEKDFKYYNIKDSNQKPLYFYIFVDKQTDEETLVEYVMDPHKYNSINTLDDYHFKYTKKLYPTFSNKFDKIDEPVDYNYLYYLYFQYDECIKYDIYEVKVTDKDEDYIHSILRLYHDAAKKHKVYLYPDRWTRDDRLTQAKEPRSVILPTSNYKSDLDIQRDIFDEEKNKQQQQQQQRKSSIFSFLTSRRPKQNEVSANEVNPMYTTRSNANANANPIANANGVSPRKPPTTSLNADFGIDGNGKLGGKRRGRTTRRRRRRRHVTRRR